MLTTFELEARIDQNGSRERRDRISHYVKLGLLETVGQPFPGTGRSRRFPDTAVRRLRVLEALHPLRIDLVGRKKFIEKIENDPRLIAAARLLSRAVSA